MKIIRNLNQIKNSLPPLALTIGNFDGVHLGHLQILSEVKKIAKKQGLSSAILTFEPHPISFLKPDRPQDFRITSLSQKLKIFQEQEIDYVFALPFNKNLSEILANDFVEKLLVSSFNIKHLIVGYDFTFGKNREGNFNLLKDKSLEFGFNLSEISEIKNQQQTLSSSVVRKFLTEGKIIEANKILGKYFAVQGLVNHGQQLASKLGFPTINLKSKPHIIKPKFGVYKTISFIPHLKEKFSSITNFGIKPTIASGLLPVFETHIPNFSQDVYGKKIIVEFVDFIREEKKFSSIEDLKIQIKKDLEKIGL